MWWEWGEAQGVGCEKMAKGESKGAVWTMAEVLKCFGKQNLRPGQEQVITHAIEGRSVLGLLPTGHGKSLCYQAAALLHGGTSVVISPLLALIREQVDYLCSIGVRAARFDSTLGREERTSLLNRLTTGELQLLYAAPESLGNPALNDALRLAPLGLLVVDEAHCLSQWGHSFRPDYLRLPTWAQSHHFAAIMAFTATATPPVREDLCRAFNISPECVVEVSPYRANIRRRVISTANLRESLLAHVRRPQNRPCIIYTGTRKNAEELAAELSHSGIPATYYHAGMPSALRSQLQDGFLANKPDVLVATIAFGMGIDKPDIRSVVHVNLPTSPEAYLQESGRAGRDGLPSTSLVLLSGVDRVHARNRIEGALPDAEGVLQCVRWLLPSETRIVSLWELVTTCDVPEDVPHRVLDILLERNAIRIETQGYKYYKVRPLLNLDSILRGRDAQEQTRLVWLDKHREGEVEEAARSWNCSYADAMEQLSECEHAGEWKLSFRQRALCLCPAEGNADAHEVADVLCAMYTKRRDADLERLDIMEQMLTSPTCLNSALEEYLTGLPLPHSCGLCPACCGEVPSLPPLPPTDISLPTEGLPKFARVSQLHRFLAGIASPALLANRLYNHPLYGSLADSLWSSASPHLPHPAQPPCPNQMFEKRRHANPHAGYKRPTGSTRYEVRSTK